MLPFEIYDEYFREELSDIWHDASDGAADSPDGSEASDAEEACRRQIRFCPRPPARAFTRARARERPCTRATRVHVLLRARQPHPPALPFTCARA
jgi:hypothetical protein